MTTQQLFIPGTESFVIRAAQMQAAEERRAEGRFLFSELSDAARDNAINWARYQEINTFDRWWDCSIDYIEEVTDLAGFSIQFDRSQWSLDPHYKGFAFHGGYSYKRNWKDGFRKQWGKGIYASQPDKDVFNVDVALLPEESRDFPEFIQELERLIYVFEAPRFYMLDIRLSVTHYGGQSFGQNVDVEHQNEYGMGSPNVADQDNAEALIEHIESWALSVLNREYDYLTSDAVIAEAIESIGYEFDENGERV